MPPSGFNQKSIEGLLIFLQGCYEDLLKKVQSGIDGETAIKQELNEMQQYLQSFSLAKKSE
jgi:hypothetical protein